MVSYFRLMLSNYLLILPIFTFVAFISVKAKKLTVPAGITGWVVGLLIFAGAGYAGVTMIAAFFVLGTGATSWRMNVKQKLGAAEKNKGRRTSGQVIANAGVAAILGISAMLDPAKAGIYILMMAGSFASAAADTLSSELGNVHGKNFYNIITLKKDKRGLNGVISLEGTITGIAGSAVIAILYALFFGLNNDFVLIIMAGTIGNLSDSVLGATLERKGYLNNNEVNFLNTAIGSIFIILAKMH